MSICVYNKPFHPRSSRVAERSLRPASAIRVLIRRVQHREPRTAPRQSAPTRSDHLRVLVRLHDNQHHRLPRTYPAIWPTLGRCHRAAALALSRSNIISSSRCTRATASSRLCHGDRPHRLASSTGSSAHTGCHTCDIERWAWHGRCSTSANVNPVQLLQSTSSTNYGGDTWMLPHELGG